MEFRKGSLQLNMSQTALVLGICLLFVALFLVGVITHLEIPLLTESGSETLEMVGQISKHWLHQSDGWIFSDGPS